jgi:hypothetical protein
MPNLTVYTAALSTPETSAFGQTETSSVGHTW